MTDHLKRVDHRVHQCGGCDHQQVWEQPPLVGLGHLHAVLLTLGTISVMEKVVIHPLPPFYVYCVMMTRTRRGFSLFDEVGVDGLDLDNVLVQVMKPTT